MKSNEGTLRRRAFIMALEVAHAYDDNKNLVPLYIVTDSDPVYEPTTPGFELIPLSFENPYIPFNVVVNSKNPTGGGLDNLALEYGVETRNNYQFKVTNLTPYKIHISFVWVNDYFSGSMNDDIDVNSTVIGESFRPSLGVADELTPSLVNIAISRL